MNQRRVERHLRRLNRQEQRFFRDNLSEFTEQSDSMSGLFGTGVTMANAVKKPREVRKLGGSAVYPRPSSAMISEALSEVRRNPSQRAHVLNFIGNLLLPMAGITTGEAQAKARVDKQTIFACELAEGYFVDALRQVTGSGRSMHPKLKVYHSGEGTPLLLRKTIDTSNALSLVPIEIEGTTLPAGMLVGIDDRANITKTGEHVTNEDTIETFSVPQNFEISPRRLTPWVYTEPVDRAVFALYGKNHYENRVVHAVDYTIEDFQTAAQTLMNLCGMQLTPTAVEPISPR